MRTFNPVVDIKGRLARAEYMSRKTGKPHIFKVNGNWSTNYYGLTGPGSNNNFLQWFKLYVFMRRVMKTKKV